MANLTWLKKYNLLIFDEIDSTNSEALRLACVCRIGNFVVWARSQTNGRGRQGSVWESGRGNLFLSILLNENIPISKQPQMSFVTALAAFDLIYSLAKQASVFPDIKLKWPNDILVNGKKISGILLESLSFKDNASLVVGIGVNVKTTPDNVNQAITSLADEGVSNVELEEVINNFMLNFEKYCSIWQQSGFIEIRKLWLKKAAKLNEVISVDDGKDKIAGIFKDIDFSGGIRLRAADGKIHSLPAGQVFFGDDNNE